jgi:hypothetical protein
MLLLQLSAVMLLLKCSNVTVTVKCSNVTVRVKCSNVTVTVKDIIFTFLGSSMNTDFFPGTLYHISQ